ncbi:MAG: hypothetical protein DPW16_05355 [Chloroflexi bacterium]|nr:hypothetical protein [Chloroflexota bacterium]
MNQTDLINVIQIKSAEGVNADRLTAQIERALGKDFEANAEPENEMGYVGQTSSTRTQPIFTSNRTAFYGSTVKSIPELRP